MIKSVIVFKLHNIPKQREKIEVISFNRLNINHLKKLATLTTKNIILPLHNIFCPIFNLKIIAEPPVV